MSGISFLHVYFIHLHNIALFHRNNTLLIHAYLRFSGDHFVLPMHLTSLPGQYLHWRFLSLRMLETTPVKHQSVLILYVSNLLGSTTFFPYLSKY